MPIRWSPNEDQTLLLKILETHPNINLDVSAIAKAWPIPEGTQAPTPRAIRERLVKIRNTGKEAGTGGHFSIGRSRPPKSASASSGVKPTTPGKPRPATPRKPKSTPTKVKLEGDFHDQSPGSESFRMDSYPTPQSQASSKPRVPNMDRDGDNLSDAADDAFIRTEKVITRGKQLNLPYSDEGENDYESGSEYSPESI